MVVEESIFIRASVNKVWDMFTDLTCWEDWNTVLRGISSGHERIEEGRKFQCSLRPYLFPVYFEPNIEEVVPGRRVVWSSRKYGISAVHEFLFEEQEEGVRVTSRERFSGATIHLGRRFFPERRIRKLTRSLLTNLKEAAEMPGKEMSSQLMR